MKLSVIMGIVHMTFGILIKGANMIFRKDWPSLIFEVITGLVMLLGLFGWMDLLIYGKWFFPMNFSDRTIITENGVSEFQGDLVNRKTPSVINVMITTVFGGANPTGVDYSFLVPGDRTTYPPTKDMQTTMYSISFYLLIAAMTCIPLMLLVKPLCCRPKHKKVDGDDFTKITNT
jgi:V-type H+-transporting ATPase subunit a